MKPGLQLVDVPEPPAPVHDEVKIKTAYAGICGTDAHIVEGHMDFLATAIPYVIGHETTGVITEIGPEAKFKGLKVGDKVGYYFNYYCGICHYCRNGLEHLCQNRKAHMSSMAQYIVVREQQVYKLPEGISLLKGALLEPVSFCIKNVERANVGLGKTVLISGGGAIGLLTTHLARYAGAARLTVSEPVAAKRELAKRLGAAYTIDPLNEDFASRSKEITDGLGFDCIVEASGAKSTISAMLQAAARGATIVYTAMYGDESVNMHLFKDLFVKELTITSVFQSPYSLERAKYMLPHLDLEPFTKNVYALENFADAFADQKAAKYPKCIIKINQDLN
jgi:(R,R)-butanediol dehydrogenase/meso-butanediol dehydrogenase/diacetyl reductase/L-iditol 2-dehydrogenase